MNRAHLIGSLLSLLALGALVLVLNSLFQTRLVQTEAAPPSDSASQVPESASPDSVLADTWKNATLDTIQFGKPRAVFTHTGNIDIYDWLPDNRRLLLELSTDDPILHNRIVTLNVETGQVVEYGRRPAGSSPPVWVEAVQGAAFLYWNTLQGEAPEIRLGLRGGSMQTIAREVGPPNVQPSMGRLFYFQRESSDNPLWVFDPVQLRAEPRALWPSVKLPTGKPIIDPTGQFLAILLRTDLPLLDLQNGRVRTYTFASLPQSDLPWWAMNGQWSPDGKVIALIMGIGNPPENLLRISKLALFNAKTGDVRLVDLPAQFVDELDWGPKGRFVLAKGATPGPNWDNPDDFWLVDVTTGKWKGVSYFPSTRFSGNTFMAWSESGQLAWLRGVQGKLQVVITQASVQGGPR